MKRWILSLLLVGPWLAQAELVQKGQPFPSYTLTDPHGVTNTLARDTRFVIIASEKDVSGGMRDWLLTKPAGFLESHHAEYVSDITPMPAAITKLFALPKMRKYPFHMLLADDKNFAATYPAQPGKLALFILDENQVIADLQFLSSPAELDNFLR